MKSLKKFGLIILSFIGLPALAIGPLPFTMNQFPFWYATAPTSVSITNTTESILFQVALPPAVVGNLGFMRITTILDGDAIANAHTVKYYLGPAAFASATPFATNTFTTSTATPVIQYVFPFTGGFSNSVYSTTTTNSLNQPLVKQTVTVGTQTNGLFLTITASNLGTTNFTTLDAAIVEALSQ